MTQAKPGDTVRLHYTGTLIDGSTFDSSAGLDPLEFTVGSGQVIPGLDVVIPGMAVGDKKTVTIAPEDAYGPRHEEGMQAVPRDQFPDDIPLEVGTALQVQTPTGQQMAVMISAVNEDEITLDANHPLAGKTLTFDIEMIAIN
ncbi:FKBP-type peptidyl-prolyl cis-trans isomerase [Pseudogemmobacter sp. W21_MBD1_M6]|uniref:FKBP-type peptidyl-prolyl cis-trans isomerase n=1 Tax=Pseudogemmobacter sp. W21_MBD1_M6 TaxID=3240271 RepID=UPI003F94D543